MNWLVDHLPLLFIGHFSYSKGAVERKRANLLASVATFPSVACLDVRLALGRQAAGMKLVKGSAG